MLDHGEHLAPRFRNVQKAVPDQGADVGLVRVPEAPEGGRGLLVEPLHDAVLDGHEEDAEAVPRHLGRGAVADEVQLSPGRVLLDLVHDGHEEAARAEGVGDGLLLADLDKVQRQLPDDVVLARVDHAGQSEAVQLNVSHAQVDLEIDVAHPFRRRHVLGDALVAEPHVLW